MIPDSPSISEQGDQRRHDFFILDNEVLDLYLPIIGPTGFLLYSYLVRRARDGFCFPKIETICTDTGLGESTVRRDINILAGRPIKGEIVLEQSGLAPLIRIKNRKRESDKRQTSNRYQLLPISKAASTKRGPGGGNEGESRLYEMRYQEQDVTDKEAKGGEVEQEGSVSPLRSDTGANAPSPPPTKPLPTNGPAQQIVAAYCAAVGIERPVNYAKAVGNASQLAKAGITPEEIPRIVTWLKSQKWVKGGVDLGLIVNQAEKWMSARDTEALKRRKYVV